ncbi:acyl-CoA/acyl-ACP dehydrogenase [SAR86 cluster bacterium]|jgi:acyl-CoA dehydrogenase|nr:acyl-CoA/acyl-ACP dehydrogenase [SAR86 cluster bacterium]
MNFEFSDEQMAMKEEVKKLLDKENSLKRNRTVLEGEEKFDKELWDSLVAMGLTAVTIPEEYGGIGMGYLELCVIAEELGRAIAPVPYSSSVYLATTAILNCADEELKKEYLPKLASGEIIGTFAHAESSGFPLEKSINCKYTAGKISGSKAAVPDADIADFVIVSAKNESGVGLYLIDLNTDKIKISSLDTFDPSRSHANLDISEADAKELVSDGWLEIEKILDQSAVLFSFEQIGGAEAAMNMAKDYAQGRYAFGRSIASFQAIKHKVADMYISLQLARSNCYFGAWALSNEAAELPTAAATARVSATKAFYECSKENIQTHGGMGATWEFDCHLFYRRSRLLASNIGSQGVWKEKLISSIEKSNLQI